MSYISQKHISKGRGPAPAIWISEDDYCLSLLFPALLVSCLELIPQGSSSLFLPMQTIFHTKPRLFVARPQNYLETLAKMCWLRKLCWSEVKKQLPLAVCPAALPSNRHLSPKPCSFPANGKWKVLVNWSSCQERAPFWGQEPLFREWGRKLEAGAQAHLPGFITPTCKAASSPEGWGGWAPFYLHWDTSFKRNKCHQLETFGKFLASLEIFPQLRNIPSSSQPLRLCKKIWEPWAEEEEFSIPWRWAVLM